jgi:excisionase family DNA binding protein
MEGERLLTVFEAAERLRANPQTIRRWLRQGKLKGTMPGGTKLGYRIPKSEIRRLLSLGKVAA